MKKRSLYCHKCREHEWECTCLDRESRINKYETERARPIAILFFGFILLLILGFGYAGIILFSYSILLGIFMWIISFLIIPIIVGFMMLG